MQLRQYQDSIDLSLVSRGNFGQYFGSWIYIC